MFLFLFCFYLVIDNLTSTLSQAQTKLYCPPGNTVAVRAAVRVRQASTPAMRVGRLMMSRVIGSLSQTQCMECLVPPTPPANGIPPTASPGGMMSLTCLSRPR